MKDLIAGINAIGQRLVTCKLDCNGICNEPHNGILPRCLFLEHKNRIGSKGCIVVGINPGNSANNTFEKDFYIEYASTYESIVAFWHKFGWNHSYYKSLKDFINCIGYDGPILWTELVKCENDLGTTFPPLQTFRNCTDSFLSKELKLTPDDWTIIAVGKEAHKALSYLYPKRSVLGVPHPTGSFGLFPKLFKKDSKRKEFTDVAKAQINYFIANKGIEHWMDSNYDISKII